MNDPLNKQSSCKWSETLWHSCDITVMENIWCHDMEMLSLFALLALCEGNVVTSRANKAKLWCFLCWIYLWTYSTSHEICTLQWRHNAHDGFSNYQPHDCLLNRLFRRRSKKTSKLRITGLWAGNSPVTSEFPTQRASNTENISIWWRHHEMVLLCFVSLWLHYQLIMQPFYAVLTMVIASTSWRVQLSLKIIICLITWRKTLPSALMT